MICDFVGARDQMCVNLSFSSCLSSYFVPAASAPSPGNVPLHLLRESLTSKPATTVSFQKVSGKSLALRLPLLVQIILWYS